ncbi:MAG: cardiolipin synthase [Desulfobacteraceae bacterium]|nr:cardiolipin synthase [Desulfobacteraceae bacterium]
MSEPWLDILSSLWPWLVALINLLTSIGCTLHIVLRKREIRAAIGWTGLVWLAPMLGAILYVSFGINRIQRRAVELQLKDSWAAQTIPIHTAEEASFHERFTKIHPNLSGLMRLVGGLTPSFVLPGNRIAALQDGDRAYPEMLAAIDGARRSVALLSYIFDNDRAGDAFRQALLRAQGRGVAVRVLIDDVGSRYSRPSMVGQLRSAGLRAEAFLPSRAPRLFKYANLRNHRKILVTDGCVGFTGGTNIREGHWRSLQPKSPAQCLHFRIDGPVVSHLQRAFALDWAFASGEILEGDAWFPQIEHSGSVWARGIPDGPDEDFETLKDTMLGALSSARDTVRICTPYFLPDAILIRAVAIAAMRGVDVKICLPEKSNMPVVAWAAMAQHWQLLGRGVRIFLTPPPFDHTKLFVVDGAWSLIGSTNWDARSLRLNFEFNVECYDEALGEEMERLLDRKVRQGKEITLADVEGRRFPVQLRDGLARLLMPYL